MLVGEEEHEAPGTTSTSVLSMSHGRQRARARILMRDTHQLKRNRVHMGLLNCVSVVANGTWQAVKIYLHFGGFALRLVLIVAQKSVCVKENNGGNAKYCAKQLKVFIGACCAGFTVVGNTVLTESFVLLDRTWIRASRTIEYNKIHKEFKEYKTKISKLKNVDLETTRS